MHLLDTDTLTHLHAEHPRVINHLRNVDDPIVGTTIITKVELLRGRIDFLLKAANGTDLLRAQRWLTRTEELLAQILIVPFDEAAAMQFDRLRANKTYRKIGRRFIGRQHRASQSSHVGYTQCAPFSPDSWYQCGELG